MKLIYCCLILFCIVGFNALAQVKKKPVAQKAPVSTFSAQMISGKKVFTLNCLVCHQVDGLGLPGMYPPLSKTTYVLGNKVQLIKIPLGGLNDQLEINGEVYTNVMPSFSILTDKEIADVLTYVRNSFGNKASAVNTLEVKKVRQAMKK